MTIGAQNAPSRNYTEVDYDDFEHVGPDTLMGRWLRRFWHPIFLSKDLRHDWPKPVRLLGEDFALFRGESGRAYLTQPQCPHRFAPLHIGWMRGEEIICRFHGWQYGAKSGQCVKQPFERRPFCDSVKLKTYPAQEYLGFVWVFLGDGDPPPMERYPRLESPNCYIEPTVVYNDFNYFNNRENDPLHTPFTHATVAGAGFQLRGVAASVRCKETNWGFEAVVVNDDGVTETLQYGMPLTNNVPAGGGRGADPDLGVWTEHFGWKLPVDDVRGVHFLLFAAHVPAGNMAEYKRRREAKRVELERKTANKQRLSAADATDAILAGKLRVDDLGPDDVDPPGLGLIMVQDWIIQKGQGVIHTKRKEERLASSDATVVINRKLLRRELRALAEGQPLKEWRYVEEEVPIDPMGTVTSELVGADRDLKT